MLIMKKHLLTVLAALFTVTAMAQYSEETALELKGGGNEYTLESAGGYAYWYYTPEENTLLTVTPSAGYSYAYTYEGEGETAYRSQLRSFINSSQYSVYYLEKGRKYYFQAGGSTTGTLTAEFETGGNVGKGFSADDPMPIVVGDEAYMGSSVVPSMGMTTYAKYTATEDGVLQLNMNNYTQVSVNGGAAAYAESQSSGQYVYKVSVENGQEYNLVFTSYSPFILTAEITHPTEGSLDMPFTLEEGENELPAAKGEYWYTFTSTKPGYASITGGSEMKAQVKVYDNKYNIEYGQVYAQSETGSYDVRFETPYTGTTYYVWVYRYMDADEPSTLTFAVEDYKQGEKEDNPIVLTDLTQPITTANAGGTTYYAVDIPADEHKFLNVEATSTITSTATSVAVYMAGNSYSATSGNSSVRAEVNGNTQGQRYIIRWISQEASPITFTASLEDIRQGDLISNPLEAKLGSNTFDADGTRYYKYTASKDCKLVLTAEAIEVNATFIIYNYGYPQPLTASRSGSVYSLSVTQGTEYYIQLDNAKAGESFTLEEKEFEQGETKDDPIIVEDGKFTFGTETYGDYWLQYTADKDGMLIIDSDVPYNNTEKMQYCKSPDGSLTDIVTNEYDGSTSTTVYKTEVIAAAGDVFLVNLKMATPHEGSVLTFTIRDFEAGETAATAIELTEGEAVTVPAVTRNTPMWYKVTLPACQVTITADNFIGSTWYQGLDNASAGNGTYMSYTYNYDPSDYSTTYTWTSDIATAGDYYIMIDQCYGNVNMAFKTDVPSGIGSVETGSSISVSGNTLNVNADNADVKVYTMSGAMVVNERVSGNASFGLEPGLYIVKVNNTVKKVIVR